MREIDSAFFVVFLLFNFIFFVLVRCSQFIAAALQGGAVEEESGSTYTLEQLKKKPTELDNTKLETYLSETDFKKHFGMSKAEFAKLPGWKKTDMKKKLQLY
jgi:hypothetical protein